MIVGELIPWTIMLVQHHLQSSCAELQQSLIHSSVVDAGLQTDGRKCSPDRALHFNS